MKKNSVAPIIDGGGGADRNESTPFNLCPKTVSFLQQILTLYSIRCKSATSMSRYIPWKYIRKQTDFEVKERLKQCSIDGGYIGLKLEDVRASASAAKPLFENSMKKIVKATGLDPDEAIDLLGKPLMKDTRGGTQCFRLMIAPLKSEERCRDKAKSEYKHDFGKLLDIVRCAIILDNEEQLCSVTKLLLEHESVVRFKNRFEGEVFTGFRDAIISIEITIESGAKHICEVQLLLAPFVDSDLQAYEMYVAFRSLFRGDSTYLEELLSAVAIFARSSNIKKKDTLKSESIDCLASILPLSPESIVEDILRSEDTGRLGALAKLIGPSMASDARLLRQVEARQLQLKEMCLTVGRKHGVPRDSKLAVDMLCREAARGDVKMNSGDLEGALEIFQEVLRGFEQTSRESMNTATTNQRLGTLTTKLQKYSTAREHYREALRLYKYLGGGNHVEVANTYTCFGAMARNQGEYEEANHYYHKAIPIYISNLGPGNVQVANIYNNLGNLAKTQNERKEAQEHYQKAMSIYSRKLGTAHPYVTRTKLNISLLDS